MKSLSAWSDVGAILNAEILPSSGRSVVEPGWNEVAPAPAGRSSVHGEIRPADVRPGDPIFARARLSAARDGKEVEVRVWRISPLGVEIVRPPALATVAPGTRLDLAVQIGRDLVPFRGLPVVAVRDERGQSLLSARWADAEDWRGDRARRRIGARWRTAVEYRASGMAQSPVGYADWVHFRIVEISRHGMQLHTSLRNKYLVPGTTFRAACSFPTLPQANVRFQVVQARVVSEGGKEVLCLGVTWTADGARARETVGQYVLQFGPGASPKRLRAEGFRIRSTARAFDLGSVRDEQEYREVLALRRVAYIAAGKASPDTTDEEMGDALDARSRIVTARWNGRLVGSIRVTFPRTEADRLRHEDYCALPPGFPARTEVVEMSKACTDPEFRGSDLFYAVTKQAALVAIQARRRFILMSCTDDLHRLYRKLGLVDLGIEYVHPTMGARHHVMLGDAVSMITGGMNPIAWNVVIGPELYAYAKLCGVVPRNPWLDLRIRVLRLLKPLAFVAQRQARRTPGAGR
ncbi:MAG TPA: GNAT family N-acyltransferase [Anaeromyxobacter sp.]|nr:GNAT family N-acyltransferase [Anaeromyxobacter sp.]